MKKNMNNLNVDCIFLLAPYYTDSTKETTLEIQLTLILLLTDFDYNLQDSYRSVIVINAGFFYLPIKLQLNFWNAILISLINENLIF